jgi:hypothetical protein
LWVLLEDTLTPTGQLSLDDMYESRGISVNNFIGTIRIQVDKKWGALDRGKLLVGSPDNQIRN